MAGSGSGNADADMEARAALWNAICISTEQVRQRFDVRSVRGIDGRPVASEQAVPDVATWRLVEALSLLAILLRADSAKAAEISLFGKTGPIEIQEDGIGRYLWAQQGLQGERSALGGRPDLVVTSSSSRPEPANAARVVEAKCLKQLDAQTVRAEFGKAHDLRVATYFIWTFYSPSPRIVAGAHGLGLDVVELGFDSNRRRDLITDPAALISHVAHALEQARRGQRFAKALEDAGQEARRKLLGPGR